MSTSDSSDINLAENPPVRTIEATILIFSDHSIECYGNAGSGEGCPIVSEAIEARINNCWDDELEHAEECALEDGEYPCGECPVGRER